MPDCPATSRGTGLIMAERLTPIDGEGLHDFADRCRRVAATARRRLAAETPRGAELLAELAARADALRTAAMAAAEYADPDRAYARFEEEDDADA
jgi:hypothetical protein